MLKSEGDRADGAQVRRVPHRRQLDPVLHVGPEGIGVPVAHFVEEVAEVIGIFERLEGPVHRAERRVHEVLDALDLLALQELHVSIHRLVEPPVELLRRGDPRQFGQRPVPVLLEPHGGVGAGQLPLDERDDFFPRPRQQVDVAHQPGVVVGADSRGTGLGVRLGLKELPEVLARGVGGLDRGIQVGARPRHPLAERSELGGLVPEVAESGKPEIAGVRGGEVRLRLRQEPGDGPDPLRQLGGVRVGEGVVVGPEIDEPVDHRALVGRNVALGREDADVEPGIARPRTAHPVVEVEPVHFGAHQVPVDLFGDRPALGGERIQPGPPGGKLRLLPRHRLGGVVRNAVPELGPLEGPPLIEEGGQVLVGARRPGRRRRRFGPAPGKRQGEQQGRQEPQRNGFGRVVQDHGGSPGPPIVRAAGAAGKRGSQPVPTARAGDR